MNSKMNTENTNTIMVALQMIEDAVASLRVLVDAAPTADKTKTKTKRATKVADPDKPKRQINPKIAEMNVERKAIYAEMVAKWENDNPTYVSVAKDELKKAVADGLVKARPSYPDALKEHSKRLSERNPDHVTVKSKASKPAASAPTTAISDNKTVSSSDSETKKRGPKPGFKLSDEEKKQRAVKRAAKKNASALPPLPVSPVSQ